MWSGGRARQWARQGLMWVAVGVASPAPHDVGDSLRLPRDIVYTRTAPERPVPFSHVTHFDYAKQQCTVCHPRPFAMLHPTHRAPHRAMDARQLCGICHDGVKAASTRDSTSCVECHVPPAPAAVAGDSSDAVAASAGPRMPADFVYPQSGDSPGRVTFRHSTHKGKVGTCATCHPSLFARSKGGGATSSTAHDTKRCGGCHDGEKSFGVEDDAKCEKCHAAGGGQ